MNSRDDILRAYDDYNNGEFGGESSGRQIENDFLVKFLSILPVS